MADTALILGIAGVVGTLGGSVSGAVIGARAVTGVERRKEERADKADAVALASAARLVRLDLLVADANLSGAVRDKRWDRAYVEIPMDAWESGRERLAFGITDRMQWEGTRDRALTSLDAKMPREPLDLSEGTVAMINDAVQMIRAGTEVLSGLAGVRARESPV